MAGDNPKIGVDVDLDGAYRQGQQWGENFVRGVNQKVSEGGIAGQVLGNGMAAQTGLASPLQTNSLLNQILSALQNGFGNLVAAVGGAGAAPAGAGPTTGKPTPTGEQEPAQAKGRGEGGISWGRMAGTVDRLIPSMSQMYLHDYSETSVANFFRQAVSSIPIISGLADVVAGGFNEKKKYLLESMDVYRGYGDQARMTFREMAEGGGGGAGGQEQMRKYGISRTELAGLTKQAASYGAGTRAGVTRLMELEGQYGMAKPGAEYMGTLIRGGAQQKEGGGDIRAFAEVLAVAIGTNLDRGRWGEAFSAMTKAAGRVSTGDIDRTGIATMMNFVGTMGARFQGDTAASGSMVGMLQGMQGGQGGAFANIAALRAAGLGTPGVSFTDAWMRVQRGTAEGGVGLAQVLEQYRNLPPVRRYLQTGSDADLHRAVFILSQLLPSYKPTDIEALLRRMTKGMPEGPGAKLVETMQKQLGKGTQPGQEHRVIEGDVVAPSLQGPDWATQAEKTFETIENRNDAAMWGAFRTGPDVQMINAPDTAGGGPGMEGYGSSRDYWPMGKGDSQEPGYKPGWRKSRPGDPKHMARDIVVGNGQPGEKVYAPMSGVWLTNTPYLANPKEQKEGYIGEMLGDNGVRYKFMHLFFESSLKKGKRVEAGDLIGTVAPGTAGWTPHLHLEARKKIAGKTSVVDPVLEGGIDQTARDIMLGKTPIPRPSTPTTAPDFVEPDPKNPGGFRPITDPDKVVPVSMRGGGGGDVQVSINLSNEARRLLNVSVNRKPATRRGVVG